MLLTVLLVLPPKYMILIELVVIIYLRMRSALNYMILIQLVVIIYLRMRDALKE